MRFRSEPDGALIWELTARREDVVLWFRKTLSSKADAIRQLSRWVLTPKNDTREHLLEQLTALLAAAAHDDLDSFPLSTESHAERRRTIWLRFSALLSTLFTAVLPGAVVWFAHRMDPPLLADPWAGYAAIASVLWACIVLMGVIDPAYADHVDTFKKVTDALRLSKGKDG